MIKTHRPRGEIWTCASVFQQTKEFRRIKLVDCTPPPTETIGSDSDEDLGSTERTAKRRRIEKLADDFLNGVPLKITSARPCPSTLKATVEWNERNRLGSKWSLPILEKEYDENVLWVDVQDEWTILRKSSVKRKAKRKATSSLLPPQPRKTVARIVTSTEVQEATSECKPRRSRAPKVSSQPSTAAMEQAAALRARRLNRATTEVPLPRETVIRPPTPDAAEAGPHSEPASIARPRFFRTRKPASTEWLLRRQTLLHDLSKDESFDELSRSRMETPSRTQRNSSLQHTYSPALPPSSGDATVCDTDTPHQALEEKKATNAAQVVASSADPLSLSFSQKLRAATQPDTSGSAANGTYYTAPEETNVDLTIVATLSRTDSQADSQTRLLRRQGISAVPRRSWTSTNDPQQATLADSPSTFPAEVFNASNEEPFIRQCVRESALHAGKSSNPNRVQSAGTSTIRATAGSTSRRRSAPSESQNAEINIAALPVDQQRRMSAFRISQEKPAYTEVQPAQQGGTPFMFRKKRTTKPETGARSAQNTTAEQRPTGRRRVTFPSSEGAHDVPRTRGSHAVQQVAAKAPVLDVSLDCDSSFGMRLNMALVDEHLNSVLPDDPGSIQRSAIKRNLRQELIDNGAELSRVNGEPPSSQVEPHQDQTVSSSDGVDDSLRAFDSRGGLNVVIPLQESDTAIDDRQSAQTQWPGTQVAIDQARRNLVMSPEKPFSIAEASAHTTPEQSRANTAPSTVKTVHRPLRELQQEQMPCTQVMMESWSPWSIAKKTDAVINRPTAHSPIGRGKSTRRRTSARLSNIASDPVNSVDDMSRRRSSLRFSTTTSDSPNGPTSILQYAVSKPSSSLGNNPKSPLGVSMTPKSILKKTAISSQLSQNHAWDATTSISFEGVRSDPTGSGAGPSPWAYEAGQRQVDYEAGQGQVLSDDPDIERTVTELVTDVLQMSDMNNVLSQRSCILEASR